MTKNIYQSYCKVISGAIHQYSDSTSKITGDYKSETVLGIDY